MNARRHLACIVRVSVDLTDDHRSLRAAFVLCAKAFPSFLNAARYGFAVAASFSSKPSPV